MAPGRQCKFHAPLLPLVAHKLLQAIESTEMRDEQMMVL